MGTPQGPRTSSLKSDIDSFLSSLETPAPQKPGGLGAEIDSFLATLEPQAPPAGRAPAIDFTPSPLLDIAKRVPPSVPVAPPPAPTPPPDEARLRAEIDAFTQDPFSRLPNPIVSGLERAVIGASKQQGVQVRGGAAGGVQVAPGTDLARNVEGLAEMLEGGFEAGSVTIPAGFVGQPLRAAITLGLSIGSAVGAEKAAKAAGLPEPLQRLAADVAGTAVAFGGAGKIYQAMRAGAREAEVIAQTLARPLILAAQLEGAPVAGGIVARPVPGVTSIPGAAPEAPRVAVTIPIEAVRPPEGYVIPPEVRDVVLTPERAAKTPAVERPAAKATAPKPAEAPAAKPEAPVVEAPPPATPKVPVVAPLAQQIDTFLANVEPSVGRAAGQTPETPAEREYSSTQVNLPPATAEAVKGMAAKIPDEALTADGREAQPHVTVKFGLHGNDAEAVRKVLADEPPITLTLGKTSLFKNDDADVVKVDVDSPDLHRLNAKIAAALPNTDTHPKYEPHVTLAYVKPGKGKSYAGDGTLAGQRITLDRIVFSGKDGTETEIPLAGAATSQPAQVEPAAPEEPPWKALQRYVDQNVATGDRRALVSEVWPQIKDAHPGDVPAQRAAVEAWIAKDTERRRAAGQKIEGPATPAPASAAPKAEEQPAKQLAPTSVANFTAAMSPIQRGRARKALAFPTRQGENEAPLSSIIENMVADGAVLVPNATDGQRLQRPNGNFVEQKRLGKIGTDYAAYLIGERAKPRNEPAPATLPADVTSDRGPGDISTPQEPLKPEGGQAESPEQRFQRNLAAAQAITDANARFAAVNEAYLQRAREQHGHLEELAQAITEVRRHVAPEDDYPEHEVYGLRVMPVRHSAKVGDTLQASYRWDDGRKTHERLDGTSAIRVGWDGELSDEQLARVLYNLGVPGYARPGNGGYHGDQIALIGGDSAGEGADEGEVVIRDAKVVAVWPRETFYGNPSPESSGSPQQGEPRPAEATPATTQPAAKTEVRGPKSEAPANPAVSALKDAAAAITKAAEALSGEEPPAKSSPAQEPAKATPRERITDAYLNEQVNYGGEMMTRAERRRLLLEAGLSERDADMYEVGSEVGSKAGVAAPAEPAKVAGGKGKRKRAVEPKVAAEKVAIQIDHVVDTQGAKNAKDVQARVIAALESRREAAAKAAGFSRIEFRPSKAYGGREGAVWVDGELVAGLEINGNLRDFTAPTKVPPELFGHIDNLRKQSLGDARREALNIVAKALTERSKAGVVTFEIPGDGTFTIDNNPYAFDETIARIKGGGHEPWKNLVAPEPLWRPKSPTMPTGRAKPSPLAEGETHTIGDAVEYRAGDGWKPGVYQGETADGLIHVQHGKDTTLVYADDVRAPVGSPTAGGGTSSVGDYAEDIPATAGTSPGEVGVLSRPPTAAKVEGGTIRPIQFPELVELAHELQATPQVVKRFRSVMKRGEFRPEHTRLSAELFKKENVQQLAATLAHEIGHLIDWLPNYTLKRGNLLGRLYSLKRFLKGTFTDADGKTIKLAEVRKELTALSNAWRPWDPAKASASFAAYRKSSTELYADAISVLLNNPGMLEAEAPTFYREFFKALDAKPDVKRAFFDLQDLLTGTPEELLAHRQARVDAMFDEANTKAVEVERQKIRDRKAGDRNLWQKFQNQHYDKHMPFVRHMVNLSRRGVKIAPGKNPVYALRERNYLSGEIEAFVERGFQAIYQTTQEAGIDWNDFGAALMYARIIEGDRTEVANPLGLSPETATQLRDALYDDLGPEKLSVLKDQLDAFRVPVRQILDFAHDVGRYSDEQYAAMTKNPAYATYQTIDHIADDPTSAVHHQVGTLKGIRNPAEATMLKTLVTMRAAEHQRVKRIAFEFLEEWAPDEIQVAKTRWNGKGHEPIESKDPAYKLVTYFENGKLAGRYVKPDVADSLNNENFGANLVIVKLLRLLNSGYFRPVFISLNLGFQVFNFYRDFQRTWKSTPGLTLGELLKRYQQAYQPAKVRAFGLPKNLTPQILEAQELIRDAKKNRLLSVTYNELRETHELSDVAVENILAKLGIGQWQRPTHHPLLRPVYAAVDAIEKMGNLVETLPKVASIIEYRGKGSIDDMPADVRDFIRRKIGSPDFLSGGTAKAISNEVFLFSNAIVHGITSDIEIAVGGGQGTPPPIPPGKPPASLNWRNSGRSGWWWKTIKANILPKLLMYAALTGALGDTLRRIFESVSKYDLTNYVIIPVGLDDKGNAHYIRLPQDETGRLLGGLFWKVLEFAKGDAALTETLAALLDYTGGQLPSVAPVVTAGSAAAEFATGRNPYDSFRNRNVLTDQEFKAGGWQAFRKFAGWEFQQLGGGIVWKFYPGESRPKKQTWGQFVLELPVVSNIIGRFYKITQSGQATVLREAAGPAERTEARRGLAERDAVNEAVSAAQRSPKPGESTIATAQRLTFQIARDLYKDPKERADRRTAIRQRVQMALARGQDDPTTDALLSVTSNAQKVAVLKAARARMSESEFAEWLKQARYSRVLSEDVLAEYRRAAKAIVQ